MNSKDFLELSKRNIFHTTIICRDKRDSKYVPNYAPWIITEFTENQIIIKDINSKKIIFESMDYRIQSIKLLICSRLMGMKFAPTKLFDIQYTIYFRDGSSLYLESKNTDAILDILDIMNKNNILIDDPLQIEEGIKSLTAEQNFYDFCNTNIAKWEKEFNIKNPKVGDLII